MPDSNPPFDLNNQFMTTQVIHNAHRVNNPLSGHSACVSDAAPSPRTKKISHIQENHRMRSKTLFVWLVSSISLMLCLLTPQMASAQINVDPEVNALCIEDPALPSNGVVD